MSKPVKEMIVEEYKDRFKDLEGCCVVDIRGIDAMKNNELRNGLREKSITVTVVKKAIAGTALEEISPALDGPCAFAYDPESVVNVARELVDWAKKVKKMSLKGAVIDGIFFEGEAGVKRLSEFPTKEEAQSTVVQLVLSPARNVVGCAVSPGSKLLGVVKEIQERLEKGETIAKAG